MDHRFEKILLKLMPIMVLIPCLICVCLASRVIGLERMMDAREAYEELGYRESRLVELTGYEAEYAAHCAGLTRSLKGDASAESDKETGEEYLREAVTKADTDGDVQVNLVSGTEWDGVHKVYLTFDDGPSAGTEEILDILKKYDVKATFFVNGHEGYEEELKRMAREGHTIGMHSYSHEYSDVYADLDHFAEDLDEVHSYVLDATGVDSVYYRFPGGTSTCRRFTDVKECTEYLDAKGIRHYDWNVSADDSVGRKKSASEISDKVIGDIERSDKSTIIVLLHDAPGKKTTIEALPAIIEAVRSMDGTELAPITESTEPVYFK